MNEKILVVDDERPIANILKYNLEKEGYFVDTAYDGEEAVKKAIEMVPDLMLLDVMLPKKSGFDVLKEIRTQLTMPVLLLTAREEETDKIIGLDLGADDYITKPFSMKEVLARVKANIRRVKYKDPEEERKTKRMTHGNLMIDFNNFEVFKSGEKVDLTNREFELLRFLSLNPDKVFEREKLLKEVWGYEFGDLRTVDVTVRRLREKIESQEDRYIITKRGVGYYFRRA
ncbi:MAG: response regulator transcription factor [Tissierellales bacterium]|nr:response regulator transcription factor [Tissierellales bacterium]MBN2827808.1 response regulator transcription factor [Tissierellales bacterium]